MEDSGAHQWLLSAPRYPLGWVMGIELLHFRGYYGCHCFLSQPKLEELPNLGVCHHKGAYVSFAGQQIYSDFRVSRMTLRAK